MPTNLLFTAADKDGDTYIESLTPLLCPVFSAVPRIFLPIPHFVLTPSAEPAEGSNLLLAASSGMLV